MFWRPSIWNSAWEGRLEDQLNRLFAGPSGAVHEFPAVNVWQNDEKALVRTELPGLDPASIEISVLGDTLTLQGARRSEEAEAATPEKTFHRRERPWGEFSRTVELPFVVDSAKVDATFHNGVLSVELPRAAEDKPRKIALKSA